MLVLTRRSEESVIIDLRNFVPDPDPAKNLVRVKVLECHGATHGRREAKGTSRLGFECNKEIPVFREEIFVQREEENKKSGK